MGICQVQQHRAQITEWLEAAGLPPGRVEALANPEWVLTELPQARPDDWDLALAATFHASAYYDSRETLTLLRQEGLPHLWRMITDTEDRFPRPNLDFDRSARLLDPTPSELSAIFSRIGVALLIEPTDPEISIELLHSVSGAFPPFVTDQILVSPHWAAPDLPRHWLETLLEQSGRFEEAVTLSVFSLREVRSVRPLPEFYEAATRRFTAWLKDIHAQSDLDQAIRYLDLIHWFVQHVDGAASENRCIGPNTAWDSREFWAWLYGFSLGSLTLTFPDLRTDLMASVRSGTWLDGWSAVAILLDLNPHILWPETHWEEYRQTANQLASVARMQEFEADPTTWTLDLGPASRSYWAARVGYAAAHLEPGPLELDPAVNPACQNLSEDIRRGLPPSNNNWELELQRLLGIAWDKLPEETATLLVQALDRSYARDWKEQISSVVRAVQSLCAQVVGTNVLATVDEAPPPPSSLEAWASVFEAPESLESFSNELDGPDRDECLQVAGSLRRIAALSANSPEDSAGEEIGKTEAVWTIALGSVGRSGLIEQILAALRLIQPASGD